MDNFSYADSLRAAFASCLPCFNRSSSPGANEVASSDQRPRRGHSDELEGLLQDTGDADTEAETLSLHSNIGSGVRRTRKRPAFSVTLFGLHLFGRPPIYLPDDDDEADTRRRRQPGTASSSTLDSDAAPVDASTIARLSSPELGAREQLRQEEERRRKIERRARRRERRERERSSALLHLTGGSLAEGDEFEGFQGSGAPLSLSAGVPEYGQFVRGSVDHYEAGDVGSGSGDADDADLGGELYARKRASVVGSASGSDSRSRTSASLSNGDQSVQYNHHNLTQTQSPTYARHEMPTLPHLAKKAKNGLSKHKSRLSTSTGSQSTTPYTPTESISASPAVAAFPIPQVTPSPSSYVAEFSTEGGESRGFPSVGLSGARSKSRNMGAFLAHRDP
ncbi:hypothetical protein BV22DRAFT_1040742 [Leucogyrophana mollusca]|uniref:Uncharacterized protein n=1 Tax=Leucogyrophana mollusca TaxID=85980 RepID=A0ACB8B4C4_9AGAM|nr:hypothetical protein BV22DRAFT_1040742 [Leucogyrophana mollusca]